MLHCCNEFARKEDMLVEINAGFGMRVWNGKENIILAQNYVIAPT
jgi:hypothetical protein